MPVTNRTVPPPPSKQLDDKPPPVPSRSGNRALKSSSASNPPNPPSEGPPALPQRPGKPPLEEPEDGCYEVVNGMASTVNSFPPKHQPLPTSTNNTSCSSGNDSGLDNFEQVEYELPAESQINQHSASESRPNVSDSSAIYESDDDCWSESEWHDDNEMDEMPGDEVYEIPENQNTDDFYCQPDPVTPEPTNKGNKPADLSGDSSTLPKPKTTDSTTKSTSKFPFNKMKDVFSQKANKPHPPPKPKPQKSVPSNSLPVATKSAATGRRQSEDNSSAGSMSDSQMKNDSNVLLPKGPAASKTKVLVLPIEVGHKLKPTGLSLANIKNNDIEKTMAPPPPVNKGGNFQPKPKPVEVFDCVYNDAESLSENLFIHDWFHGDIDRAECEKRIVNVAKIGTFVIRASKPKPGDKFDFPYSLSVQIKGEVKHLRIRLRKDGKFALGTTEKTDEITFTTVEEFVDHHREQNVKIIRQDQRHEYVKLTKTPKKP